MFPLKLLGAAAAAGVALGVWGSGLVKEKLGGGNFTKVKKSKTEVIVLPDDIDISQGLKVIGKRKKTEEIADKE